MTIIMKKIIKINTTNQSSDNKSVTFKKFEKKEETESAELTEEQVKAALSNVFDPELPVSIVDLGLIYDTKISGSNVNLKMTLTTPGCSMGSMIAGQAEMALKEIGADNVLIEIIWDPPWNPDMMSDEAKQKLGIG